MGLFDWGKSVESAGSGIANASESIRFALTGDLPPQERVQLEQLLQKAREVEAELMKRQIDINVQDSKSPSLFKSGWRPALGWVALTGFSLQFVLFPLFDWALNIYIVFNDVDLTAEETLALAPPSIDGWLLLNLLGAMLGIGTLRTIEKGKGLTK